jgi:hypothetical protein
VLGVQWLSGWYHHIPNISNVEEKLRLLSMANARRRTQRPSRTATRMAARTGGGTSAPVETEGTRASNMIDWQKEMLYINKDLRELLIISVILFALLFLVGFFL